MPLDPHSELAQPTIMCLWTHTVNWLSRQLCAFGPTQWTGFSRQLCAFGPTQWTGSADNYMPLAPHSELAQPTIMCLWTHTVNWLQPTIVCLWIHTVDWLSRQLYAFGPTQ